MSLKGQKHKRWTAEEKYKIIKNKILLYGKRKK